MSLEPDRKWLRRFQSLLSLGESPAHWFDRLIPGTAEAEKYPVAGLVQACPGHPRLFPVMKSADQKDVDARVKPAQGEFNLLEEQIWFSVGLLPSPTTMASSVK
jgi:hypothetical protein